MANYPFLLFHGCHGSPLRSGRSAATVRPRSGHHTKAAQMPGWPGVARGIFPDLEGLPQLLFHQFPGRWIPSRPSRSSIPNHIRVISVDKSIHQIFWDTLISPIGGTLPSCRYHSRFVAKSVGWSSRETSWIMTISGCPCLSCSLWQLDAYAGGRCFLVQRPDHSTTASVRVSLANGIWSQSFVRALCLAESWSLLDCNHHSITKVIEKPAPRAPLIRSSMLFKKYVNWDCWWSQTKSTLQSITFKLTWKWRRWLGGTGWKRLFLQRWRISTGCHAWIEGMSNVRHHLQPILV